MQSPPPPPSLYCNLSPHTDEALARRLQLEEEQTLAAKLSAGPASPTRRYHGAQAAQATEEVSLREIMDEEMAMDLSLKDYVSCSRDMF